MAAAVQESIEHKTLMTYLDKLAIAFQSSLAPVANELVAKAVIPPEIHGYVLTEGIDSHTKATKMMMCVADQVRVCPGKYYDFMSMSVFEQAWIKSLRDDLTSEYEKLKAVAENQKEILPKQTSDVDQVEEESTNEGKKGTHENGSPDDEVFRCPCGQCTLESYLDEGCPKSSSHSFPYLDLCKLDEDDRKDLKFKLSQDISEMMRSFADLFNETCVSLDERGVDVSRLARHVLSLGAYESSTIQKPLLSEDEKELKSSKSIDEAFIILRHHMSFFNFELLKHITDSKKLCTDDDRQRMEKYCQKFGGFCRRKVFEVSPSAVGLSISKRSKRKRKSFAVLITKHEREPNLVFVNEAIEKIASLLKLKPSTLHLHRIDKGSLILVFSVPTFVAKKLFPLEQSMRSRLRVEGFLVLTPHLVKETQKGHSKKVRRFSWPLGKKERKETSRVVKAFSQDCLHVKGNSNTFLLLFSAERGHSKTVKALVEASTPQETLYVRWNGMTALMLASKNGHTDTVKVLIAAGARAVLGIECNGETALMLAAKGGHTETVRALIEAGAELKSKKNQKGGWTALMIAAAGGHTKTVKTLIAAGADVSLKDDIGRTALMMAADSGHSKTVKTLITAGADFNLKDDYGMTALMMAANIKTDRNVFSIFVCAAMKYDYRMVVKTLIEAGADVTLKDNYGRTALMMAAEGGHNETVQKLIAAGAELNIQSVENGRTALMMAAEGGHNETVKTLIAAGADVSLKDNDGWTALMRAAKGGHNETVQTLIAAGADLNILSYKYGWTGLMIAAADGNNETVQTLIAAGADLNIQSFKPDILRDNSQKSSKTALMMAAGAGHNETVKTLIAAGADVSLKDDDGRTALMMAARGGYDEIVQTLIAAGADTTLKDYFGQTAFDIASSRGYQDPAEQFWNAADNVEIPQATGQGTSDELFYYRRESSGSSVEHRAESRAGSSVGSHCSFG